MSASCFSQTRWRAEKVAVLPVGSAAKVSKPLKLQT
jgi:hypothetical protein